MTYYGCILLLLLLGYVTATREDYRGDAGSSELRGPRGVFCPSGTYVTGFKLRSAILQKIGFKEWKFGGITGLILLCRGTDKAVDEVEVTIAGNHGNYSVARECLCNSVVRSAKLQTVKQGNSTIINNINMYCKRPKNTLIGSGQHKGRWSDQLTCPKKTYVCGVKTVFTGARIEDINFKCCAGHSKRPKSHCKSTVVSVPDPFEWVPTYHFDTGHQCWPDPLAQGYNGTCRKSFDQNVPVYSIGTKCGSKAYKINYMIYYGFQNPCFLSFGSHPEDWEHVRLNFVLCGGKYCIDSVTYHQHNGWYTVPYLESDDHSVHVYISQFSHGSYPKGCSKTGNRAKHERCLGGCLYFEDYRRPGGVLWTPTKLWSVTKVLGTTLSHSKDKKREKSGSCDRDPLSCEDRSCERNEWFFG